jgi:hypothetical protein
MYARNIIYFDQLFVLLFEVEWIEFVRITVISIYEKCERLEDVSNAWLIVFSFFAGDAFATGCCGFKNAT